MSIYSLLNPNFKSILPSISDVVFILPEASMQKTVVESVALPSFSNSLSSIQTISSLVGISSLSILRMFEQEQNSHCQNHSFACSSSLWVEGFLSQSSLLRMSEYLFRIEWHFLHSQGSPPKMFFSASFMVLKVMTKIFRSILSQGMCSYTSFRARFWRKALGAALFILQYTFIKFSKYLPFLHFWMSISDCLFLQKFFFHIFSLLISRTLKNDLYLSLFNIQTNISIHFICFIFELFISTHNLLQFYRQKLQFMKQRAHDPSANLKTHLKAPLKKPPKKVKKAEQTRTAPIHKTKPHPEHNQNESFKDVISKFKKLLDERVTLVKDEHQQNTERVWNKKPTKKPKKHFNDLFSTIEYKLNQHLPKSKTCYQEQTHKKSKPSKKLPLQKSKSKSREKSRVKSGKKSFGSGGKKHPKFKGKEIMEVRRINTIFTQEKSTLRKTFYDVSGENEEKSEGSVIVYNVDDDDGIYFERTYSQKEKKLSDMLKKYLQGFLAHNEYLREVQKSYPETFEEKFYKKSQYQGEQSYYDHYKKNQESSDHFSVEKMKEEEESKWLSFMEGLSKMKKDQQLSTGLDQMIEQAKKNYLALKNMTVVDLTVSHISSTPTNPFAKSTSNEHLDRTHTFYLESQSPKISSSKKKTAKQKRNYEYEAPLQISRILKQKRKSIEELCLESEHRTKQLSQKKLKEDIDLMEFMSNSSADSDCISSMKKLKLFASELDQKQRKLNFKKKDIIKSEKNLFRREQNEQFTILGKTNKKSDEQETFLFTDQNPQKEQQRKQRDLIEIDGINKKNQTQEELEWRIKKPEIPLKQQQLIKTIHRNEPPPVTPESQGRLKFHQNNPFTKQQKPIQVYQRDQQQVPLDQVGQAFIRANPTQLNDEKYVQLFFEQLVEEFILEIPSQIIKTILAVLPSSQIYQDPQGHDLTIQCSQSTVLLTAHDILQYMKKLPNQEFFARVATPLGLRSQEMLGILRKIKHGDEDSEMQESNYHSVIDLEHICEFQTKQNPANSDLVVYQQFFNQSIFDAMNVFLDQLRPFGRHGYPPICFQTRFHHPTFKKIYNYVMSSLKHINRIKLGLMHFQIESQAVIRESLELFTQDIVKELEEEWLWMKEGEFQICLQIMTECEEIIFTQEVLQCCQVIQKKQLLS